MIAMRMHWLVLAACAVWAGCKDTDTGKDSEPVDADNDGYTVDEGDCDDGDPAINPDADELCGGIDEDCDGLIDDEDTLASGEGTTFYIDADGDSWGEDGTTTVACLQPAGFAEQGGDCDDTNLYIHPGAAEVDCTDPVDYNCDGSVTYEDADMDGAAACMDCDDQDPARSPDLPEVCGTANIDEDCDGLVNDNDPDVTGTSDWYVDKDGDGYAADSAAAFVACVAPVDYVAVRGDCYDKAETVNPGATEVCDAEDVDEDCNGAADDADAGVDVATTTTWYADADNDGYGTLDDTRRTCDQPTGYTLDTQDCDDGAATVNPAAPELCNTVDDDCDGAVDDEPTDGDYYAVDLDGDGFGAGGLHLACSGVDNDWDCDDTDPVEPVLVDVTLGSTGGAGTLADPLDSIQAGIDQAEACVIVRAGTYAEVVDYGGKDVQVVGVDGADSTVIDATALGAPAVTIASGETSAAGLIGFTLTGGDGYHESSSTSTSCGSSETCTEYIDSYCGGGLYVSAANPSLAELVVRDNLLPPTSVTTVGNDTWYVYSFGGGACFRNTAVLLQRWRVFGNFADVGGGAYLDQDANVEVERSLFQGNLATDGGGFFVDAGALTLGNVILAENEAVAGGGVGVDGGTVDLVFTTAVANDAGTGLAMAMAGSASVVAENSILVGDAAVAVIDVEAGSTLDVAWCDTWNAGGAAYDGVTDPTGSDGNLSVDPEFVGSGDYHLSDTSPCVDAGDPTLLDADGTIADQGAFGGPGGAW